jgi:hypothetical protein
MEETFDGLLVGDLVELIPVASSRKKMKDRINPVGIIVDIDPSTQNLHCDDTLYFVLVDGKIFRKIGRRLKKIN